MWVDDYFHYQDWETSMREAYDSFNLLVVPRKQGDYKYFYNLGTHRRIVPQGIFPPPNGKRTILQAHMNDHAFALGQLDGPDNLSEMEKEPMQLLVLKELKKAQGLKQVDNELSFVTNLSNIKQGLKQDYSDKEILRLMLANGSFTDKLIEEHLKLNKNLNANKQA